MSKLKFRLTWSRQPNEQGLARVCQGERGKILKVNGTEVASVTPVYDGFNRRTIGYGWCARCDEMGIKLRNTYSTPVTTVEEAMEACAAYVRTCMRHPNENA